MTKAQRPTVDDLLLMLCANYDFAHDARNASTRYAIDKKTRVASEYVASRNTSLFNKLLDQACNTRIPGKEECFAPASLTDVEIALRRASVKADAYAVTPARRSCRIGDAVWVDLGHDDGESLRITAKNLDVMPTPTEIVWMRSETFASIAAELDHMGNPFEGVPIFQQFLQKDQDTIAQLYSLMVHRLIHPNGPGSQQPLLLIIGPSGAGKTIVSLLYQDAVDPKTERVENTGGDLDPEALCMNAAKSSVHVVGNISKIDPSTWDLICTIVTGASVSARKLYSQDELSRKYINSQLVITGVSVGRIPEDVVTRMLRIELGARTGDGITERALWSEWDQCIDKIRYSLWMLCAQVLDCEQRDLIPHDNLNARLKDFEMTLRAVDSILHTNGEQAWLDTLSEEQQTEQSDDPIYMAVLDRWVDIVDKTVTSEELYKLLKPSFDYLAKGNAGTKRPVPGSGRSLAQSLNRAIPAFRSTCIDVTRSQDSHSKKTVWKFTAGTGFTIPESPIHREKESAFGSDSGWENL